MRIAVVGTGYVGLVSGTCLAETGVTVTCVDVDASKIDKLNQGGIPIYEPGLAELVIKNRANERLFFTTSLKEALVDADAVFIAVGTPPDEDGSADLSYVIGVAHEIGCLIEEYVVVVTKSTVPVGTNRKVKLAVQEELDKRGVEVVFDVASNPEFLKEGDAVNDFMRPDRVVIGVESARAEKVMERLYHAFVLNNTPIYFMDIPSAEMTKYAANSMLATRISFMNDMADDLDKKSSAFWNCKVDAYICPLCAYLYALVPLGFRLVGNKFVFQNIDCSLNALINSNETGKVVLEENARHSEEKYATWVARTLNTVFKLKIRELNNIPVILRGTNEKDGYTFNILHKDILNILKDKKIMEYLEKLSKDPNVKIKNDFLNVYESSIENLINYNNQYRLINRLIKASIETESILSRAVLVFKMQVRTFIIMRGKGENTEMNVKSMANSGYKLRKAILAAKGVEPDADECMRGTIYRLTNALSVGNTERFMDMIIRLYTSSRLDVPNGFVDMLQDREKFNQYGYAFILGLKGSHYVSKEENENG